MRHARAHCYVNVGDGDVGTVIIHNAIKEATTSTVGEYSCNSPGGRLPHTGPKTTTRYGPKPKPLARRVF